MRRLLKIKEDRRIPAVAGTVHTSRARTLCHDEVAEPPRGAEPGSGAAVPVSELAWIVAPPGDSASAAGSALLAGSGLAVDSGPVADSALVVDSALAADSALVVDPDSAVDSRSDVLAFRGWRFPSGCYCCFGYSIRHWYHRCS